MSGGHNVDETRSLGVAAQAGQVAPDLHNVSARSDVGHDMCEIPIERAKRRAGRRFRDNHSAIAGDHQGFDTQGIGVASEDGQVSIDTHDVVAVLAEIRERHRMRQDFHRAEKRLTLQIKSIERRLSAATDPAPSDVLPRNGAEDDMTSTGPVPQGEGGQSAIDTHYVVAVLAAAPLYEARAILKKNRMVEERACQKLAKQLHVWPWVEAINGFGALGLAQIVAETGNLSNYANPGKVWKRMGLAVIDGKSQRKVAGAAALEQGYSPVRRSIMFCIGDSLIKKQNAYRDLYLARKEYEKAKAPDLTPMQHHRRAQRYMEKRLLKHLWQVWRGHLANDDHGSVASPSDDGQKLGAH